jgi:hypothetical protein
MPKPRDSAVLQTLQAFHDGEAELWYDQYLKAYRARENGAPRKGIRWNLSLSNFWDVVIAARGRCQVTQQPFDRYHKARNGRRPFLPSLDRVDSIGHYELGNVELTTLLANLAIADFGREEFFKMVKYGAVSDRFGEYLERTSQGDENGLLDNVLPWIRHNAIARYILSHFERANREPEP